MIGSFEEIRAEQIWPSAEGEVPTPEQKALAEELAAALKRTAKCRYLIRKCLARPAEGGIRAAGTELVLTGPITEKALAHATNLALVCATFDSAGDALLNAETEPERRQVAERCGRAALAGFVETLEKQIETEASWDEKHVLGVYYPGKGELDADMLEPILKALDAEQKLKIGRDETGAPVHTLAAVVAIAPDRGDSKATCRGCPGCEVAPVCRFNNISVAEAKKAAKAEQEKNAAQQS